MRCLFGAVGTSVITILYKSIGAGWTFVMLTCLCIAALPLPLLVVRDAPKWRARRAEKKLLREQRKKAEKA